MSKESLYLFPYKMSSSGVLSDGTMQGLPQYCSHQCNSKKCRDFYAGLKGSLGRYKCPYGFAVCVEQISGVPVFFVGMDIVGISDKKLVQKRTTAKDFIPRLKKEQYEERLIIMANMANSIEDYYSQAQGTLLAADNYQSKIETLDNTFHELRKLNGRLKASVEWLTMLLDNSGFQQEAMLSKASKDIFAASQLISIRLSTYDLILNPNSALNYTKSPLAIYKKFDKVARLLDYQAQESGTIIKITGNSYCTYECSDMVELLPYLLLDNALKYTMWGKDTNLIFQEIGNKLKVTVKSFSIRPADQELNSLLERGIRSKNVTSEKEGQGLGLYLARYICDANNISINLSLGKRIEEDDKGIKYSDFIVTLQFDGISH